MSDKIEMLDGRVYLSDDNWQTIRVIRPGGKRARPVTDKGEIETVRYTAVAQSSAGP